MRAARDSKLYIIQKHVIHIVLTLIHFASLSLSLLASLLLQLY